ncbi:SGNH/GDSL hydrolase family protein [Micropruina glycogenica]|uniref:SGNH hydrolase-type esterase domain-containing protein n=1 Tax=Micropruina glycogenica TaxID=75385 RepID=A0A2N9JC72_9ACTN|nr:hypothetical protein [Micropruina glycogenica]SPD85140.1 conserved protein of unknown function [Micropruina glycogenica]
MPKPFLIVLAVVVIISGGAFFMLRPEPVARAEPYEVARATAANMQTVESARVFFAHQSVGDNVLEALPTIFRSAQLSSPTTIELGAKLPQSGGFIVHTHIGSNGEPLGKIADFDHILRAGLAESIDVAMLKLCFVDFNAETDVNVIFESYKSTMASLAASYPDVRFVYTTVPLMADRDLYGRLKALLGRGQEYDPAHNAARERYNALVRAEYAGTGRLFDVAAVQAVGHGDMLRYKSSSSGEFLAMDPALTSDGGHLNQDGADLVARNWLAVIAHASAG